MELAWKNFESFVLLSNLYIYGGREATLSQSIELVIRFESC